MTEKKPLSENDRNEILNLLNRVAYILDAREYDRLGEVFDADMHFENPGRLKAEGLSVVIESFSKVKDPALSFHTTNVIITLNDDGTAHAMSKALTMRSDKSFAPAQYTDVVKMTPAGWRIASRTVKPLPSA